MRWLALFVVAGCAADPCRSFAGQTCVAVEVRGQFLIDQLLVSANGAFTLRDQASPPDPREFSLPVLLPVLAGDAEGAFTLSLRARLGGIDIGSGLAAGNVIQGGSTSLVVNLSFESVLDLAQVPDQARPIDLAGVDLRGVQCDLVTQQPCSAAQKCIVVNQLPTCQPDGPRQVAQSCSTDPLDDCARGNQCLFIGDLTAGTCEQFCSKDADCKQLSVSVGGTSLPNNRAHCLFQFGGSGPVNLCSLACNPVASKGASGCPSGAVCVYGSNGTFPEFTFCDRAGTGTDGQACNASFRCAAGFNCLGVGGGTLCRAMCRANTDGDCPAPLVCKPGAGGSPPMFGYCCPAAGC